jgi:hypothetical protein
MFRVREVLQKALELGFALRSGLGLELVIEIGPGL